MNYKTNFLMNIDRYHFYTLILFCLLMLPLSISAQFTEIITGLTPSSQSSVAWGDYDNDGDLDILLTGYHPHPTVSIAYVSKVFRNDGNDTFVDIQAGLASVINGSAVWGDYDNDGDLDILLTGFHRDIVTDYISKVYRNDGNGSFTDISANLLGVNYSTALWGDYDNDGDLDIFISGMSHEQSNVSKIYRNDNGTFTDVSANLPGVLSGAVAWGDYDNDGDLDLLLTGKYPATSTFIPITKLYRNDSGVFTDINAGLTAVSMGSVAWGDYDNDGDIDILLMGNTITGGTNGNPTSKVYRNDGNGVFTDINANLSNVYYGSATWGDYDNDGDLDIGLMGSATLSGNPANQISKIYRNDGNGLFTDTISPLVGVCSGSSAWGDYDNDGDIDILLTGYADMQVAKIYRNDSTNHNTLPIAPSNLQSTVSGDYVIFTWEAGSDIETPTAGLTYNLRIGASSGGNEILSAMAQSGGDRLVSAKGIVNSQCSWKVKSSALPSHYYWSVQTVDGAYAGSAFAAEQEYLVSPSTPQNLTMNIVNGHLQLSWDRVTQDTNNTLINPHFYLVFYNDEFPYDSEYTLLAQTSENVYTIDSNSIDISHAFFKVCAVVLPD